MGENATLSGPHSASAVQGKLFSPVRTAAIRGSYPSRGEAPAVLADTGRPGHQAAAECRGELRSGAEQDVNVLFRLAPSNSVGVVLRRHIDGLTTTPVLSKRSAGAVRA